MVLAQMNQVVTWQALPGADRTVSADVGAVGREPYGLKATLRLVSKPRNSTRLSGVHSERHVTDHSAVLYAVYARMPDRVQNT
ncbi:hypothetical protein XAC908_140004 [Xanthomonas citri pv. citri]|nr:hypothetical protein XAC908_140004 [Xanthomonas citri pv. citri]CEH95479.1 hypothetical protein XACG115_140004 [Xanthomonas citri pv. citri]